MGLLDFNTASPLLHSPTPSLLETNSWRSGGFFFFPQRDSAKISFEWFQANHARALGDAPAERRRDQRMDGWRQAAKGGKRDAKSAIISKTPSSGMYISTSVFAQ